MAASLLGVGCGDDDTTPPVGTDGGPVLMDGGARDSGPPVGTDGGPVLTDSGPGMTDAGATGTACTNAADLAAIMATYAITDGGSADGGVGVSTLASACGLGCVTSTDIPTCVATCVRMRTGNAVSMGCAQCYGISVECTATNCLSSCGSDPTSAACTACRCGMNDMMENCVAAYTACSGIPSSTCAAPDGGMTAADGG